MDGLSRTAVVIDAGSGVIKAGFAGDDKPKALFDNIVGVPKHRRVMVGGDLEGSYFVGRKAEDHRGALVLSHPMEHGAVVDWDAMARVLSHLFDGPNLAVAPEDQPHREQMAQLFFEKLRVPALHVSSAATLALYGSGRTTGLVVDCGDGVTSATPIYEGFSVGHAAVRCDMGGRDVTDQLQRHLRRAGHVFHTSAEREVLRGLKERACYVARSPAAEEVAAKEGAKAGAGGIGSSGNAAAPAEYTLPDGTRLTLGAERFRAAEALFAPALLGLEHPGVGEAACMAAAKADLELRPALLQAVVLAGGGTALRGFGERLLAEMRRGLPPGARVKIYAPGERKVLAWAGGSILASLGSFRAMAVRKDAYDELGAAALARMTGV